jgi:hypothetical protein
MTPQQQQAQEFAKALRERGAIPRPRFNPTQLAMAVFRQGVIAAKRTAGGSSR